MEICGGQTHTIVKSGLEDLLPREITLVHGPGCPVCVTPIELIDKAVAIAHRPEVIFCSFGDMLRVPGSAKSLFDAKAEGADVRIVYSPLDALKLARQNPDRQVVFFAVGFETTAPANAMAAWQADHDHIENFSLLVSHVLVPPAMEALLSSDNCVVQGFLAAGHVCTIMGYEEYFPIAERYKVPIVVTGFEPLDILEGILMTRQPTRRRPPRGREPIQPGHATGREPACPATHPGSIRSREPRMARAGRNSAERLPVARQISEIRCQPAVSVYRRSRARISRMHQRADSAGHQKAPRVSGVCREVHARESARRSHGFVGRCMRGLLSLWQTPKPK